MNEYGARHLLRSMRATRPTSRHGRVALEARLRHDGGHPTMPEQGRISHAGVKSLLEPVVSKSAKQTRLGGRRRCGASLRDDAAMTQRGALTSSVPTLSFWHAP